MTLRLLRSGKSVISDLAHRREQLRHGLLPLLAEQRAFQRYGVSVCIFEDINPAEFLEQQETLYLVTRPFLKAQRACWKASN
jgi:hypothetical protein